MTGLTRWWSVARRAGASGNVCSEEIVHALDCMGYGTVDLAQLVAAAQQLPAPDRPRHPQPDR